MKHLPNLLAAAGLLGLALAGSGALAQSPAEAEYDRGYDDCRRGRYDNNSHPQPYRDGCTAGEAKRGASTGGAVDASDNTLDKARQACLDKQVEGASFTRDQASVLGTTSAGGGLYNVEVKTPAQHVICTVDRAGDVKRVRDK